MSVGISIQSIEELHLELASCLSDVQSGKFDLAIRHALHKLVHSLDIDLACFAELSAGQQSRVIAYYSRLEKLPLSSELPAAVRLAMHINSLFPEKLNQLLKLPDDIPSDAITEPTSRLKDELKSLLAIPLSIGGDVKAVMILATSTDQRDWADGIMGNLQLIGQQFANAFCIQRKELALQLLREQMCRLARVNLMGELFAAVTHEISQPLTAIQLNAQAGLQICRDTSRPVNDTEEIFSELLSDTTRIIEIITRVQNMYLQKQNNASAVSIQETVRKVLQLAADQTVRNRTKTILNDCENELFVAADRIQLQQVILNLVINGIDAMKAIDCERLLTVSISASPENTAVITISDTGSGIELEHQPHIFDPFYTTKPSGIGIGLAISRSIVESYHGSLRMINSCPKGTTFQVILPRQEGTCDE